MNTNFGPKPKTMLEQITAILKEYADGSNILKELIQNADDAAASSIAFLLDPTQHPVANLAFPDLGEYQGPALYSWNDSIFTEKDWEGIQHPGKSVKETTVLKVGRFGMGFVSVYHLTDTPTILSDELLGINHPLRELSHLGDSGVSFSIEDLATDPSVSGHLSCFKGYFGYNGESSYGRTVFRLPLRKKTSAISASVYEVTDVREKLLLPLMAEVEYTLLFLKSVSSIEILEKVGDDMQSLFRAEIPSDYQYIVKKYRKDVTEFVSSREYLTHTKLFVCLFPTTSSRGENGEKREKVWLVLNLIGFGSPTGELRTFHCEDLNYLPWVGLGLATGVKDLSNCNNWCFDWNEENPSLLFDSIKATFSKPFIVDPETELDISTGRIFCFLPTQLESKFPFHIHSYFSLSSNRRSIDWPAPDNQNDKGPKWNQLLTQNLTAIAYAAFLHIAISALEHPSPLVYHYKLLSRWSPHEPEHTLFSSILRKGLQTLSRHLRFFTRQNGGKWLPINEAIFLPSLVGESLCHEDVCLKLFELLEQPIVNIPPCITEIILNVPEIFSQIKERTLTPVDIRDLLAESYCSPLCREYLASDGVCIALLQILLPYVSTLESNQQFLDGVPLLPIAGSNQPHLFRYNGDAKHFISDNAPAHLTLFPDLAFVNHFIPPNLYSILLSLARGGTSLNLFDLTNLENNPELFSQLLTKSLSCLFKTESLDSITWRPGVDNQPPASWIIKLHHFIGTSQSLLSAVSHLPLLPQQSTTCDVITLLPLKSQFTYIEISKTPNFKWLEEILECSGCYMCVNQSFIECFSEFVLSPIPAGLIPALRSTQILNNFLSKLPQGEDEMFQLIDSLIPYIDDSNIHIVKQLPVFLNTRGEWLMLHSDIVLPPLLIPSDMPYPPHIISPFKNSLKILYGKLKILPISTECFLTFHLLPFLVTRQDYDARNKLIVFVLENILKLDFDVCGVGARLKNTEWIADAAMSDCLHTPSSLLDPRNSLFKELLLPHTKSLFPSDICCNHLDIMIKFLDLKSSSTLTLDLLVKVCQHSVETLKTRTGSGWKSTFDALLHLLYNYFDSFDAVSWRGLLEIFTTPFICLDQLPPNEWPHCIRFQTSNQLCSPQDLVLCHPDKLYLIGSISHTFLDSFSDPTTQQILNEMGMIPLSIEMVINQLNYLSQTEIKASDRERVYRMVSKIYNYLNCNVSHVQNLESKIIFIPDECKFVSKEIIVFETPFDLVPNLYSIQQLRYESTQFFHFLGINQSPSPAQLSSILCNFNNLGDKLSDTQLKIVVDILKYFAEGDVPLTEFKIYIPGKDLGLYEPGDEKLVFWDQSWPELALIEEDFVIVHGSISNEMAFKLGVSPFSERVAPSSEDFWCEESGQQVCVTDRLRSILEAYSGNINVLKEMLQNADDARATIMRVVFDWRKHPTQSLLNTELKDWQGPAILFYNDSVFSCKDFENIVKIDGATKAEDGTTIGRYGLGFCTVYHFTDVPSFVSRNYVQIFDPQKKYLRRSKGGCKIDFCNGQYAKYIGLYRDQFAPYEGIFGCSIMNHHSFNGTLFRIPIRSSDLSSTVSLNTFEHSDIIHLQESFVREAEHLLFFTQCIKSIEIYDLSATSQTTELIHAVRRDEISPPPIPHPFLHTNNYLVELLYNGQPMTPAVSHCEYKLTLPNGQSMDWMVTYATGSGVCVEALRNLPKVAPLPFAGVAINLDLLRRDEESEYQSTLYCFFPLPISTSFPFHCHAMFELRHDRQGLVDSVGTSTEWNKVLVSDALVLATLTLYQHLAEKVKLSNEEVSRNAYINILYKMFARQVLSDPLWEGFAIAISKRFSQSEFKLFPLIKTTGVDWENFSSTYFLDISSIKSDLRELWSHSFSRKLLDIVVNCGYPVAIIPDSICENSALLSLLFGSQTNNIIDLKMFTNIFFSNLSKFSIDLIVDILIVLISACTVHIWLREIIISTPCIPCGDIGIFREPNKVVDPNSQLVAQLFERIENRLPSESCIEAMFTSGPVLDILRTNLGLITCKLSDEELKGRAEYINAKFNRELAVKLIEYLDQKIFTGSEVEAMRSVICNLPFVPAECPNITESFSTTLNFFPPSEIIPFCLKSIAEFQLPVCPENIIIYQDFIANFIQYNGNHLPREITLIAIDELRSCIAYYGTLVLAIDLPDKVTKIYETIGEHCLPECYSEVPNNGILIPLVGFCDRARLLLDSNVDFPPYIFSLNSYYATRSRYLDDFFMKMGINKTLSHLQCMIVIEELYNRQGSISLTPQEQQMVLNFILHIYDSHTGRDNKFLFCRDNIIHLVEDCVFYDLNWTGGESEVSFTHKDKTYYFIHDRLSNKIASELGAIPLSHIKLSGRTSLPFTYISKGQSEPLPRRLKNILSEYESDIDIFKELTQNADDAHATEIKFLFDYSHHGEEHIIHPEMKHWQGPALYCFNNATFSDTDFEKITQLAGCSKMADPTAIGTYGIGFNTVYHLTDLPSFVSRHLLTFFDPQVLYLSGLIHPHSPGMQIDFVNEWDSLMGFKDQFSVYNGIFGCDLSQKEEYDGTLFRLPLRTPNISSEISQNKYNPAITLKDFQHKLCTILKELIIFLQSIDSIELYERSSLDQEITLIHRVTKFHALNFFTSNESHFNDLLTGTTCIPVTDVSTIKITTQSPPTPEDCEEFIVSFSSGTKLCFDLVNRIKSANQVCTLPVCSVAVPKCLLTLPIEEFIKYECHLFCFLPLPCLSPYPMHINGSFQLQQSRRALHCTSDGSIKTEWNQALIADALPIAVVSMLISLTQEFSTENNSLLSVQQLERYYSFWPNSNEGDTLWGDFSLMTAECIRSSNSKIFYCRAHPAHWIGFEEASLFVTDPSIYTIDSEFTDVLSYFASKNKIYFVKLPLNLIEHRIMMHLNFNEYKIDRACREIIFPCLAELMESNPGTLKRIISTLLENLKYEECLKNLLTTEAWFPCGEDNPIFRAIPDVISPNSVFSQIFYPDEKRIPSSSFQSLFDKELSPDTAQALISLGVISSELPLDLLVNRCSKTCELETQVADQHAKYLLDYINSLWHSPIENDIRNRLQEIPFIPVYQDTIYNAICPDEMCRFSPPSSCCMFDKKHLSPCYKPVTMTVNSLHPAMSLLGISHREISLQDVLDSILLIQSNLEIIKDIDISEIAETIRVIYLFIVQSCFSSGDEHLNCEVNRDLVRTALAEKDWIFSVSCRKFYPVSQTVISSEYLHFNSQFLNTFSFIQLLSEANIKQFFEFMKIPTEVTPEMAHMIICLMKEHFGDSCLPSTEACNECGFVIHLVNNTLKELQVTPHYSNTIYLLTELNQLELALHLYLNDAPWIDSPDCASFVHHDITLYSSERLGAKSRIESICVDMPIGFEEFGQYESISNRIDTLLREFPCDVTIFKELIQNAEDAKATEVGIILDCQSYGDEYLCLPPKTQRRWQELQRVPSLLIYNNRPFTEDDIQGIQAVGIGGKQGKNTIGRFGLGFNSVYHLTRVPCLLTCSEDGSVSNFCIFDPYREHLNLPLNSLPGLRRKIKTQDLENFIHQFLPYFLKPVFSHFNDSMCNLRDRKCFSLFRLPLNRSLDFENNAYKTKELLSDLIKEAPRLLPFITHVKNISIFHIKSDGTTTREGIIRSEIESQINSQVEHPICGQNKSIEIITKKVFVVRPIESDSEQILSGTVTNEVTWLIYHFDGSVETFCQESDWLSNNVGIYDKEKLRLFSSLAVETVSTEFPAPTQKRYLYCHLPFGNSLDFPVHINCPFILDPHRRYVSYQDELTGSSSWDNIWHSEISKRVLTPLYFKLLVDLGPGGERHSNLPDAKYFAWYYTLFPIIHHTDHGSNSMEFLQSLGRNVLKRIHNRNSNILLADDIRITESRTWYPILGSEAGTFKVIHEGEFGKECIECAKCLVKLSFRFTFAPPSLASSFQACELECELFNSQEVVRYINRNVNKIAKIPYPFPCSLMNSVLCFEELDTLLKFILKHSESESIDCIPLKVDSDRNLGIFNHSTNSSFTNKYVSLLPHLKERFLSEKYDTNIVQLLIKHKFVENLNAEFVAYNLNVPSCISPEFFSFFWSFILELSSHSHTLSLFYRYRLVPVIYGTSNQDAITFINISERRSVAMETINIKFKFILQKLECPFLCLSSLQMNDPPMSVNFFSITNLIASLVLNNCGAESILNCISLCQNVAAVLSSDEAYVLRSLFQGLSHPSSLRGTLLNLRIFVSHTGPTETALVSLSGFKIYLSIDNIPLIEDLIQRLNKSFRILFLSNRQNPEKLIENIVEHSHQHFVELEDLVNSYILTASIFPHLDSNAQIELIRFFNGLDDKYWIKILISLKFIKIQQCLYKPSDLFCPNVPLFVLYRKHLLLPQCWLESNYTYQIIKKLGLNVEMSLNIILEAAKDVANSGNWDSELTRLTIESLIKCLDQYRGYACNDPNLQLLANISFLPLFEETLKSTEQDSSREYMLGRFSEAQLFEHYDYCCTSCLIFHPKLRFRKCHELVTIMSVLGLSANPPIQSVKIHLNNLIHLVKSSSQEEIKTYLKKFFFQTYEYLQSSSDPLTEFQNVSCILFDCKLYRPINIVMKWKFHLSPYLFQCPLSLQPYRGFLKNLGVCDVPSYKHFKFVLTEILTDNGSSDLIQTSLDNKVRYSIAKYAFGYLIEELRSLEKADAVELDGMLLITDKDVLISYNSPYLFYADDTQLQNRVSAVFPGIQILALLNDDKFGSSAPPACLKLKFLSVVFTQTLCSHVYDNYVIIGDEHAETFQTRLKSPQVYAALKRIYFHQTREDLRKIKFNNRMIYFDTEEDQHPTEQGYLSFETKFDKLCIIALSKIEIEISDTREVPQQKKICNCTSFLDESDDRILINTDPSSSEQLPVEMTYQLNQYFCNLFDRSLFYLLICLVYQGKDVNHTLNDFKVRQLPPNLD